jgi:hypothetical protein
MTSSRQRRNKAPKKEPRWLRCLFVLRVTLTRWLLQSVRNIFIIWLDGQQFNDRNCTSNSYNMCGDRRASFWVTVGDLVAGRFTGCLITRRTIDIVARIPSPCVPLPKGEGMVQQLQLPPSPTGRGVGVRETRHTRARIVARFGPHSEF